MNERSSAAHDRWREIIRRQSASGLSVAEFCRRDRLPASSFFAWKRKLGPSPAASAFVEATVARTLLPLSPRRIEVLLRGGRRVRVGAGFDHTLLAEVVAALEAMAP
jgi:hypothetical protein